MSAKAPEPAKDSAATTGSTPTVPAAAPAPAAPAAAAPAPAPVKAAPRPPAPKARTKAGTPKSSTGVASGAFVVAVCALLVAIGAIAVSIYSLQQAREAISKNADRAAAPAVEATSSTAAPAATAPAPSVTSSAPRVTYSPEFVRAEVKMPAPSGCGSVFLDVDTLKVGDLTGHEFYLSNCSPPLALRVDRTSGATSTSANPSPEMCGSMVAGTSTNTELVLPARGGLTFCLLTNKADATAASLPQRLAIIEVTSVGVDNSVSLAVSTFRVIAP